MIGTGARLRQGGDSRVVYVDRFCGVGRDEEGEEGGGEGADWGSPWPMMTFIYVESDVQNGRREGYRCSAPGRTGRRGLNLVLAFLRPPKVAVLVAGRLAPAGRAFFPDGLADRSSVLLTHAPTRLRRPRPLAHRARPRRPPPLTAQRQSADRRARLPQPRQRSQRPAPQRAPPPRLRTRRPTCVHTCQCCLPARERSAVVPFQSSEIPP